MSAKGNKYPKSPHQEEGLNLSAFTEASGIGTWAFTLSEDVMVIL